MKKIYYILLLAPLMLFSQNGNQNYIKTQTYTGEGSNPANVRETVTYFDGLGRPIQQIAGKASPDNKDIITHIEYDDYGRQAKEYLPYVALGGSLEFDTESLLHTQQFYNTPKYENTTNPYNEQFFEKSPLNRPIKTAAPGALWEGNPTNNNDHTIKLDYQTNKVDEVIKFVANFPVDNEHPQLVIDSYYGANKLYKNIIKDENWTTADGKSKTTEEFKDFEGNLILKRNYTREPDPNNSSIKVDVPHDTYYVYDAYSNLTYVIPPLAVEKFTNTGNYTFDSILNLCYQYNYDYRNRVIRKHVPDNGWTYMVYDKLDRIVMMQDEKMRAKTAPEHNWLFTGYDALDRVALTGSYYLATPYQTLREAFATQPIINETRSQTPVINKGMKIYYNNTSFGYEGPTVLTVNYYDDYNFNTGLADAELSHNGTLGAMPSGNTWKPFTTRTKSLQTGSIIRILGTNNFITSFTQYDKKAHPIWVWSYNNYLNAWNGVESNVDFIGKTLATKTQHKTGSNAKVVVWDYFTYDNVDRPSQHTQVLGDNPNGIKEMISWNKYDALGAVEQKKVGGKVNAGATYTTFNALQTVDFTQNIRGWLKGINATENITDSNDLFAFGIDYEGLFNGNISGTNWASKVDNQFRNYSYTYDALNRLTDAIYTNSFNLSEKYHEKGIKYDRNGNITALERWGNLGDQIDVLTYDYQQLSNRLNKVEDSITGNFGFKNGNTSGNDYSYDEAGNLTKDLNKEVTSINYNHLNLPTVIKKNDDDSQKVVYEYDAGGAKVQKRFTNGGNTTTTNYSYGFIYQNNVLQYFSHPEGYLKREGDGTFSYVYQYKDHLGNVRLSYSDLDKDGVINDVPGFYDGFEDGNKWNASLPGLEYGILSLDSEEKHSGEYSGKIVAPANDVRYSHPGDWLQINNTQDTWYTYSAWVKSDGPQVGMILFMKTSSNNDYYNFIDTNVQTINSSVWTKIEKQFLVPATVRQINVRLDNMGHTGTTGTIWFDDVSLQKTNGVSEIVSNNDYYAFGMQHNNGVVSAGSNSVAEKIKYNGKELQDELGLSMYDYGARNYDPAIGRWFNIDPKAEVSRRWSTYNYCYNNPIFFVDPDGMQASPVLDTDGNLLGTDSQGWKGEAIVMDKKDFKQGMDHDVALTKGTELSKYGEGIKITDNTWDKIEENGGEKMEPFVKNESSQTVFYKPEGLDKETGENLNPGKDSSKAYPIKPGTDLYAPVDGVNTSAMPKGTVFKTPGQFPQITVDKNGIPDISGILENFVPKIGIISPPDASWNNLSNSIKNKRDVSSGKPVPSVSPTTLAPTSY